MLAMPTQRRERILSEQQIGRPSVFVLLMLANPRTGILHLPYPAQDAAQLSGNCWDRAQQKADKGEAVN